MGKSVESDENEGKKGKDHTNEAYGKRPTRQTTGGKFIFINHWTVVINFASITCVAHME